MTVPDPTKQNEYKWLWRLQEVDDILAKYVDASGSHFWGVLVLFWSVVAAALMFHSIILHG